MIEVDERSHGGDYGRQLIENALSYRLDAKTSYDMTADGVHCTIDMPASTDSTGSEMIDCIQAC